MAGASRRSHAPSVRRTDDRVREERASRPGTRDLARVGRRQRGRARHRRGVDAVDRRHRPRHGRARGYRRPGGGRPAGCRARRRSGGRALLERAQATPAGRPRASRCPRRDRALVAGRCFTRPGDRRCGADDTGPDRRRPLRRGRRASFRCASGRRVGAMADDSAAAGGAAHCVGPRARPRRWRHPRSRRRRGRRDVARQPRDLGRGACAGLAGAGIGPRHRARADRLHRARLPGRPSHRLVPLPDTSGPRLPRGRRRTRRRGGDVDARASPAPTHERVGSRVRMGRAGRGGRLGIAARTQACSRARPSRTAACETAPTFAPAGGRAHDPLPARPPRRSGCRREARPGDARRGPRLAGRPVARACRGHGDVGVRRVAWAATPTRRSRPHSTWAPRGRRPLRRRHRRGPQRAARAAFDRPALPSHRLPTH